jgi:NADP-dependent 3-hydroxy acid dehydrogenase YdfG
VAIDLNGKVVLITGASSGFGQDAADLFAAEAAVVVLAARRIERMQAQVARIHSAGGKAMAVPVDVSNRADIYNMVKSVIENFGQVDILFNNAGFGRLDWLENLHHTRDIETQIAVNLTGLIEVTHAVLPYMLARNSGHIINMSSVAGWLAAPTYSIYAATKFGVRGFTDALRREVQPRGIYVSGIYPGPAVTEFGEHTGRSNLKKNLKIPGFVNMTSEYVASKVVAVAKRPRRALILPWWFVPIIWFDSAFPAITDWLQMRVSKRFHT